MNVLMTRHCVLMTTSNVLICQGHTDVIAEMVTIASMEFVKVNTHLYSSVCTYVTGFTKTILIGTRNEIQFIADY